ncbi:MAG: putative Na+/H+ and antiporter, NhaP type [Fibrobacteres bacterium]|nr:putative Na+/H+ and antiporter, NhaP type [Fibrobacterota bacterium]
MPRNVYSQQRTRDVDLVFTAWYIILGCLLVSMALTSSWVKRLPLTTSLLYLGAGVVLGRYGSNLIDLGFRKHTVFWEHLTEAAVLVSLFSAGLKLRVKWHDERWRMVLRLAFGSMLATVALITLAGFYLLKLPLGAALLLGAVLAPTDPVLASDVQVAHAGDRDRLRFSLTGEAGMNDGSAFPFLMLALGLLGLHEMGPWGLRWAAVDLIWGVVGGVAIGAGLGIGVGKVVLYFRREHKEALGLDDFLALGLIALAYGISLLLHAYGFLAVFAAGIALRHIENRGWEGAAAVDAKIAAIAGSAESAASNPETAPAYMAQAVLVFNEQMERICEITVVLLLGGALDLRFFTLEALWFIPMLFLLIRPISTWIGLWGTQANAQQKRLIGWFGIRGIGSLYYMAYALNRGLPPELADRIVSLTLATVAVSIVVHGISVTPLMNKYSFQNRKARRATGSGR